MATPITTSTTVREAVTRYPGAEAIFDAHGLIGCGGPNGPLEPIGFFAVVHHVDPQKLIDELNDFAASRPATGDETHAPIDAGRHTYPLFLTTALIITLTTGITSGIAAALTGGWGGLQGEAWTATVQTHGHVQVFGFLALFIMGIALHILPRFKGQAPPPRPLLLATYWTMLLGVAIRATTQPHGQGFLRVLLGASALLELAGILLFAGIVASVFWRARTKREPYDRFLEVATAWLVVLGGMNAYLVIHAAIDGRHVLAAAGDAALLEAAVYGFVVLFVLGVSYRALPFFLSLRPAYAPLRDAALAIIAVALPLRVAAVWAPEFGRYGWAARTDQLSTFALAIGVAAAAAALRVFESPAEDAPAVEAPPAFRQMVQAAYVWLLAGVALDSYWRLRELSGGFTPFYAAGAVRHAFLLGFATLMLMAMAYRTVPVFSGRPLRWRAGIPASFLMVLGAGVLRVFPVALTLVPSKLDFKLLTAAGVLLFCGLAVFFAELLSSMFARFAATPAAAALANATTTQTTPAVAAASAARAPAATPAPAAHRAAPATHTNGAVPAANANGTSPVPVANGAAGPVRREMTVADALALSPRVLPALIEYGFGPLTDPGLRARMAPVTTIERAAAIVNVDPDALVATLNRAVGDARAETPGPSASDDGIAPIDMRFTDTAAPEAMVRFALKSCYDPEIPINIVDLGLVYAVAVEGTHAYVRMTLTAPGCPMADEVEVQVRDAMLGVPGIESVDVDVVTAPPWTPERMSAAAKRAVGWQ